MIVGVNGGTMGTRNHCMRRELSWARRAPGVRGNPAVSLYVNTQDPGPTGAHWPADSIDRGTGLPAPDRYGVCRGGRSMACGWQYGWNGAETDVRSDGIRAPGRYVWWLDVETTNVWMRNRQLNRAVLTGMADYFQAQRLQVGVYSTHIQWAVIAGSVSPANPLYGLPEWVTGAGSVREAKSACRKANITGGPTVVTQWFTSASLIDGDVACPIPGFRKLRMG